jgi:hypothetical protein
MPISSPPLRRRLPVVVLALLALPAAPAWSATLNAEYSLRVSGIPIGSARLAVTSEQDRYTIKASGEAKGLARIFSDGEAAGQASGQRSGGHVTPARYSHEWTEDGEKEEVDLGFQDNRVASVAIAPEPKRKRKVVPLTEEHKAGVLDPLSAAIFPVEHEGPEVCDRTLPLFDGHTRFDLHLAFSRVETVKGPEGSYSGPAYVCSVRYRAVAGHRPGRKSVTYMEANKDIEVWMAPVATSGLMAPVELRVRTRAGMLVMQARKFAAN